MGTPDPFFKRQLNGMGGGISSLSKCCVISLSQREECDVEYLFAQVDVDSDAVDYAANCGNLSAAVGPYAVESGVLDVDLLPRTKVA